MSSQKRVLVVEDDAALREAVTDTLKLADLAVDAVASGAEALRQLEAREPDLVVTDLQMDGMDGMQLLSELKARSPGLPAIMVTAHGSVAKAVEAMRIGASDFLVKPFDAEVLLEMVCRLLEQAAPQADLHNLCTEDPASRKLYRLAQRVAASDATVLLQGESGTGKEVLSRYIHRCSLRRDGPFVAINCAAIPEQMLESMLFGYEKGAYTGAYQARPGKFEQAEGGTILLDEISEMDLGLQAKLLRVLQEKEVERLGSQKLIKLDVRVLATTNRDLRQAVQLGHFREDLFYRLSVFPLKLPALRHRPADILPLARLLLSRCAESPRDFSPEAESKLLRHGWPGNVRELENAVQRAAILASGAFIEGADLMFEMDEYSAVDELAEQPGSKAQLDGNLKVHEQQLIMQALDAVGGSRKAAAEKLGISPRTLRYKLARLRDAGASIPAVNS